MPPQSPSGLRCRTSGRPAQGVRIRAGAEHAPDELVAHLAVVARRIGAAQTRVFGAARAGIVVAGYGVDHLHVHVLPIRTEEELQFSSARKDATPEEIEAAMARLRAGLREDGWEEFVVDAAPGAR